MPVQFNYNYGSKMRHTPKAPRAFVLGASFFSVISSSSAEILLGV